MISKIIAIVVSVFSAYKAFFILVHQRKDRFRSDYEFAEKFMADDKWKTLHDYLLEQGYLGLTGKKLEASIIRYFLNQKDPLMLFAEYIKGRSYLIVHRDSDKNIISINLKELYNDEKKFRRRKIRVLVQYVFLGMISLLPLVFLPIFISNVSTFLTMIGWMLSFGFLAYVHLDDLSAMQAAKFIKDKFVQINEVSE
jgi:hypothetical protein